MTGAGGAESDGGADLSPDTRLVLDVSTRRIDHGRVLIGGSPLRLVRLTATGAGLVDRLVAGGALGPSEGARRLARRLLDGGVAHPRWDSSPFEVADVTVVIPVYADPDGLRRTLDAICADPSGIPSLIVVDDASPEAGPIADAARAAGARLIRRELNGGPGAARNAGMDHVTTPIVAFVDADVVTGAGWLRPLLVHFCDPRVVGVAPRVVARVGARRAEGSGHRVSAGSEALAAFDAFRSPLDLGPTESRVAPRTRVAYVPTAALVGLRSALVSAGGFDEALRFGEDVDLVWRLDHSGRVIRYEPRSVVTHPARPDLASWLRQRFDYGRSAAPLARRHPGALAPVSVSGWSAAAWGLAVAGFPVLGGAVAAGAAVGLPRKLHGLERPWKEGLRLAGGGTWKAWRPLASAVRRTWWPAALAASLVSRRARRAVLAAVVIPPLVDWWQGERPLGPAGHLWLRFADDVAYGAGVWAGCLAEGTLDPLRPDLGSWPGPAHRGNRPAPPADPSG